MFDEGIKKVLENEELMELMMESVQNDEFYINNGKVKYSLKECLMSVNEDVLKIIYLSHTTFENTKVNKKDLTRQYMVDFLMERLPKYFMEFLENMDSSDINMLNDCCKNKYTADFNITLLSNGFAFGFKEKDENVFVVPKEFIELYKNNFTEEKKKENDLDRVRFYIFSYLMINGMVPKKFFNDLIINNYNIDLSAKEIEDYLKQCGVHVYKNKYYSAINGDESRVLEEVVKLKKHESYCILNDIELFEYKEFINNLVNKLSKIIKEDISELFNRTVLFLSISEEDSNYYLSRLKDSFNLNDKQLKKVEKIIDDAVLDIRFWNYHGYTSSEYISTLHMRENALLSKPKDTTLKSCLEALSDETYEEISYYYMLADGLEDKVLSVDKLSDLIIEEFREIYEGDPDYYKRLFTIISSGIPMFKDIEVSDMELGFVFSYYQGDKIICVIPDEINDIIISDIGSIFYKDEYIMGYLRLNGVLEKTKLQQLLKENHNIDLSNKEIDKICKDGDIDIIDNKYYSIIDEDMAKGIIQLKNDFSIYKKLDLLDSEMDDDFFDELDMFFEGIVDEEEKREALTSLIVILNHSACYSDDMLRDLLSDTNVSIKEKQIKELIDVIKKYKNDIAVWQYNGFTLKEYNGMKKVNKKIGRNEPCACGSGKKYKQCCGR